jgi:hypothetical protein
MSSQTYLVIEFEILPGRSHFCISTHVQKWTSPLTGLGKFPEFERKWKLNKNTSNKKISFK